ncbi:thioesterase family protein [Nocardia sp. NPDC051833]|uniref:acyl-CoA thioesterase n=1 Tax=Nocardia sp. NPDC051833 TaxID=3155674 RepID=UPI0034176F62
MTRTQPDPTDLRAWYDLRVRLADDDHYGHVNNAVYYEYFDSAINGWLIENLDGVRVRDLPALGVVVSSSCQFLRELHFPDRLRVGIAVARVGRSSVTYRPAIFLFGDGGALTLCAHGEFVHVYVDPQTRRPVPVPEAVRALVAPLAEAGVEQLAESGAEKFT